MLREDGFVMDDGTVARLAETRYLITTTTAHAVRVYQHMHFCHQVLWPELDVQFVSVTDQWAQFAVAGPRSRELLERVLDRGCDISNAAFPYMANGAVTLANGQRGRLFRISFSGEMAYEIAVPARSGEALIRQLFEAGADMGVTAYGLESLNVMRIEKGHMTGNELNGQTTAYDLGLGRMCSTQKDYVGATMARRASLLEPARPRLVGIRTLDPKARLAGGMHFVPEGGRAHGCKRPGPRVVGLLLADPEPVDRPRSAQAWPGATRRAGRGRRSATRRTNRWSRSVRPSSSTQRERAFVSDDVDLEFRTGRFGRAHGEAGVSIHECLDFALASVIAKRGQAVIGSGCSPGRIRGSTACLAGHLVWW